jgi:UDP-N-acetylmuramoyl-tripeptide--D-alanyl-D-alanine ligase
MRLRTADIAAALGGRLVGDDVVVDAASFDSRAVRAGQLFVPIVADRDGHDFVRAAVAAGATAYLTARPALDDVAATAIEVTDTSAALMGLARWARRRLDARVVGITGSVGKTTTKDFTAAACAAGRRTTANERSFNNEQGLPVTILGAPDDTEVLILEMGMRGFDHITRLCDVARPDIGVVTVVGESHTEMMGGLDGVAKAKSELVAALPAHGTAILNQDDERVAAMAALTGARVLTFGVAGDVRPSRIVLDERARASFTVDTPWGRGNVRLAVPGRHMVANAAAALAVAGTVGVPLEAAIDALTEAQVSAMRMALRSTPAGATVVDDAYNANPTSMGAALEALAAMDADRRVAVLGEMGELADPGAGHRQVADHARALGLELIAVGTDRYGVSPVDDVTAALGPLGRGAVVLVKASRSAGLERVVDELVSGSGPAEG